MLVDYARVSWDDQDLALQRDAPAAAGCERAFTDTMSSAKAERPAKAEPRTLKGSPLYRDSSQCSTPE
jgi:DNA invertase Pin-like site-specific DNA recombinase